MYKKLHFEDKGQDFLWWVVKKIYESDKWIVSDCGPFQRNIWRGTLVFESTMFAGSCPVVLKTDPRQLKYQIEKIEDVELLGADDDGEFVWEVKE